MDLIERLPLSDGQDMILVVVCHLTKMALFIPTFHDIDAEDLVSIFLSQVFANTAPQPTLFPIGASTSSLNFGGHSSSCWESKPTSRLPTTLRPMVKLNRSTRSWISIFGCMSATNRTTGSTSSPWLSLHTTTPPTLPPWHPFL